MPPWEGWTQLLPQTKQINSFVTSLGTPGAVAVLGRDIRTGGNSLERPSGSGGEGQQIPEGKGDCG